MSPSTVHNHGVEEGAGLACREYRIAGRLVGECVIAAALSRASSPGAEEREKLAHDMEIMGRAVRARLQRGADDGIELWLTAAEIDAIVTALRSHVE